MPARPCLSVSLPACLPPSALVLVWQEICGTAEMMRRDAVRCGPVVLTAVAPGIEQLRLRVAAIAPALLLIFGVAVLSVLACQGHPLQRSQASSSPAALLQLKVVWAGGGAHASLTSHQHRHQHPAPASALRSPTNQLPI